MFRHRVNATLARELAQAIRAKVSHDSFTLRWESQVKLQDLEQAITVLRQREVTGMRPAVDEAAIEGLKFSECLPLELAREILELRLLEPEATRALLEGPVRSMLQELS